MLIHPPNAQSLITVSLAVLLFALVLSLGFHSDNKDALAATATATHAAALVVFVGSSGTRA
jgi:hypothetical protein